jgi:uncharacterized membrane protein YqiK
MNINQFLANVYSTIKPYMADKKCEHAHTQSQSNKNVSLSTKQSSTTLFSKSVSADAISICKSNYVQQNTISMIRCHNKKVPPSTTKSSTHKKYLPNGPLKQQENAAEKAKKAAAVEKNRQKQLKENDEKAKAEAKANAAAEAKAKAKAAAQAEAKKRKDAAKAKAGSSSSTKIPDNWEDAK